MPTGSIPIQEFSVDFPFYYLDESFGNGIYYVAIAFLQDRWVKLFTVYTMQSDNIMNYFI